MTPDPMPDTLLEQLRRDVAPDAIGAGGQPKSPRHRVLNVSLVTAAVAEIDRLRALQPPDGLPTTLGSVDDVRQVCIAAGLTRGSGSWSYLDDDVHVGIVHGEIGWQVVRRDGCGGQLVCEASDWIPLPAVTLWGAITAARGGFA